jgi:hypothetical protein
MKYVLAGLAFLLALWGMAFLVAAILAAWLPVKGPVVITTGTDWRNLLGQGLGLMAGVYAWTFVLRRTRERQRDET